MKSCQLCGTNNWIPIRKVAFDILVYRINISQDSIQESYLECLHCGTPARQVYILEERKSVTVTRRVVQSRIERLVHSLLGSPLLSTYSHIDATILIANVVSTAETLDRQLSATETESSK